MFSSVFDQPTDLIIYVLLFFVTDDNLEGIFQGPLLQIYLVRLREVMLFDSVQFVPIDLFSSHYLYYFILQYVIKFYLINNGEVH